MCSKVKFIVYGYFRIFTQLSFVVIIYKYNYSYLKQMIPLCKISDKLKEKVHMYILFT